jgi:DNA repair exonuclease SbcCD ATPase subunit
MKSEMIDKTSAKITNLECETSMTGYEGDEKLQGYEDDLKLFLTQKELILLKERYSQDKSRLESMTLTETEEKDAQIENIKNTLWKEYTQEELDSSITEYRAVIKELEILHRTEKSLESYKVDTNKLSQDKILLEKSRKDLDLKKDKLAKLILQQELYECPSCNAQLRLQGDELKLQDEDCEILEESTDDLKREISQLSKTISRLEISVPEDEMKARKSKEIESECKKIRDGYEDEIPEREEVVSSLEYLQEYKRTQKELEKKLQNLEKSSTSSTLQKFKEQLTRQKERIKELESLSSKPTPISSEEEVREKIQNQKQAKDRLSTCNRNLAVLKKEFASFREGLAEVEEEYTSKYSDVRTESEVESEIESVRQKIQALIRHREKYRTYFSRVETYERSVDEVKRYKEWESKVKTLTEEEVKNRRRYASAMTLKEKILEAESIAISNVISSINIHAQEYLDLFFPVDPIVVRLEPFKKTKKKTSKPQITLEIDYKGMEADLSMLSGGELARVVLAYTLALSEIFNSPLIMLDECTASLDQDMTSIVMEGIRKNFNNKLVVVIAHQVISADFDRIIHM